TVTGMSPGYPIDLRADTLIIDADRQICSLIWRGSFVIDEIEAVPRTLVFAGIELPGYPLVWPEPEGDRERGSPTHVARRPAMVEPDTEEDQVTAPHKA